MNIALLAHDRKKELLVQFSIAYCGVLCKHKLCAPSVTGKMISDATGLSITKVMPCSHGGSQQIGAFIKCNEVDFVLFFCDPSDQRNKKDIDYISRLCDRYNLPLATNLATAEVLVRGLNQGEWTGCVARPPVLAS